MFYFLHFIAKESLGIGTKNSWSIGLSESHLFSLFLHAPLRSKQAPRAKHSSKIKSMAPEYKEREEDNMNGADTPIITFNSTSLDWPAEDELEEVEVQCAGRAYLAYESRLLSLRDFLHGSSFHANNAVDSSAAAASDAAEENNKKEYDLLNMSEKKLDKLNYYQVLQR
eukprot:scaffold11957_cov69-Skeletonema_dohrnii-CCMP3373.AAC.2